jgi:hypothetical protein
MFSCRRFQPPNLFHAVRLDSNGSLSRISSNASEYYVGAWAPRVGCHALAEGGIPLLSVFHAPAHLGRLEVRFVTRLARSLGSLRLSSDHGFNALLWLLNFVGRFTFTEPNLPSVYPRISFERVRALCRSMGSTGAGSRLGRGCDSPVFGVPYPSLSRSDVRLVTHLAHSPGSSRMFSDHGSTFSSGLSASLIALLPPNPTYALSAQARKFCLWVPHFRSRLQ